MKRFLLLLAVLLAFAPAGRCEGADALLDSAPFNDLAALSQELGGVDIREVARRALAGELPLDADSISSLVRKLAAEVRDALLRVLKALAFPALAAAVLRLVPGGDASGSMTLLSRLSCACILAQRVAGMAVMARTALGNMSRFIEALSPALTAALALTGSEGTAAVLSPAASLCAGLVQKLLADIGLPLCGVAAVVAASANLSDHFRLNRLFALLRKLIVRGVGLALAGFVALMALEGLLATGQDAAASRAVRRALQGMLPIVGGATTDAAGALLGSAQAVRGAVGVAGVAAAVAVCARPLLQLTVSMLSIELAAALLEPVAEPGIVRAAGQFAGVAQMLQALVAGGCMLAVLLVGAAAGMAGGL